MLLTPVRTFLRSTRRFYGKSVVKKHGFWFVDIPRTSSSSIHAELGRAFGSTYGKKDIDQSSFKTGQIFPEHMTAEEARELFGSHIWNQLFTFSLVRNPYSRTLSMFRYRKQRGGFDDMTFEEYVNLMSEFEDSRFDYYGFRFGAYEFLYSNGKCLVDYIAKFENRARDLRIIGEKIGCGKLGSIAVQGSPPKKKTVSDYYTESMAEIIQEVYRKDFDAFSYSVDPRDAE